jgi:hypothetical protein
MGYRCVCGDHECDGCGYCKEGLTYICPVCGEEVRETVFVSNEGVVLGCDNCAQIKDPCDMIEDNDDAEYEAWRDSQIEADYN